MAGEMSRSPDASPVRSPANGRASPLDSPPPRSPLPDRSVSRSPVRDASPMDARRSDSRDRGRSLTPKRSLSRGRSLSPRGKSLSPRGRSLSPRGRSISPRPRSLSRGRYRSRSREDRGRYRSRSREDRGRYRSRSRDRGSDRRGGGYGDRDRGGGYDRGYGGGGGGGYGRRSPPRYGGRARSPPRGRGGRRPTPPASGTHLFVAGLNFITTEREVEDKFMKFGDVHRARIVRNTYNGESRGFGFVEMKTEDGTDRAIRNLDGGEWNGRRLLVERARNVRSDR